RNRFGKLGNENISNCHGWYPFLNFLKSGSLLGQHEALELRRECGLEQSTLLFDVLGEVAHCRRSRRRATCVAQFLAIAHVLIQMMLYVEPRTLVLRLVLRPNDFLGIRVLAELGLEGLVRERIQL